MTDERRELTVFLARHADQVARTYHFSDHQPPVSAPPVAWSSLGQHLRFAGTAGLDALAALLDRGQAHELVDHFSQAKLTSIGDVLFHLLLGTPDLWEPILRRIFHRPDGPRPNPIFHPVRVRIQTTDPLLSGLPWRTTSWDGRRLIHNGWTFEVTLETSPTRDVHLPAPCRVLVIAPVVRTAAPLDTDQHLEQLREALQRVSSHYEDPARFKVVTTRAALQQALQTLCPEVIYYFGHGEVQGGLACLVLADPSHHKDLLSMTDFKRLLKPRPLLVMLNGCLTGASGFHAAGHQLCPEVPMVVSNRTTAWTDHAGPAAIAFLEACLGGGHDPERDPVAILDRLPSTESTRGFTWTTTIVHAAYRRWTTGRLPQTRPNIGLRLDRTDQRNSMFGEVSKLVGSRERRVLAMVAYGEPGTRIDHASDQLMDYLETIGTPLVRVKRIPLRFPDQRDQLMQRLVDTLRVTLGIEPFDPLEPTLRRLAPPQDSPAVTSLLWLDWGTFGSNASNAQPPLNPNQLAAWLEFCCTDIAPNCPRDIRLVSFLAMEVDSAKHKKLVVTFNEHRIQFSSPLFTCYILPSFPHLSHVDLHEYLQDPTNTRCPLGIAADMAKLLFHETQGHYQRTLDFIQLAEKTTWGYLKEVLLKSQGELPPASKEEPF